MSTTADEIEVFRDYAKKKLENHKGELDTRYQNRELASIDLKEQAYKEHEQIFQRELSDKIEEIITKDNQFLRPALNDLKERFIEKLKSGITAP